MATPHGRLRIASLRPGAGRSARRPVFHDGEPRLSRRALLGLGGAAAAASIAPPVLSALQGAFELRVGRGRVSFLLDGLERFAIDVRRFAGSPKLEVSRAEGSTRVTLSGARYPGTRIPADMEYEIKGTRLGLRMRFGGFAGEAQLQDWLLGNTALRSPVALAGCACDLGGARLDLDGPGEAAFSSDWALRVAGRGVATLDALGAGVGASAIDLALLAPDEPSLLRAPAARRARVSIHRGDLAWPLWPELVRLADERVVAEGEPFEVVHLELNEPRGGSTRGALLAESDGSGGGRLLFRPAPSLRGAHGAFALALDGARYASALDGRGADAALVARLADQPAWLHAGGVSLLLGAAPTDAAFEITAADGRRARTVFTPALIGVAAPLAGAVVQPVRVSQGTRVELVSRVDAPVAPGAVRVVVPEHVGMPVRVVVPIDFSVDVVRPRDLLALRFDFINMQLVAGEGTHLERIDPFADACVIVHFPPQNIAEEAFFEADANPATPEPPPPDGSPTNPGGSDPLPTPPVGSRLAGPSRLAFKMPATLAVIPYTLEDLLTWTGFEQKVASTALPPPVRERDLVLAPLSTGGAALDSTDLPPGAVDEPPIILPPPPPPVIHEPAADETAIEAPWRVILSPNRFAAWAHSKVPVERNGRTELWHTRLGQLAVNIVDYVDEDATFNRTVRAIWTPGYDENVVPEENCPPFVPATFDNPFRHSLTPFYRWNIVRLSSDFTIPDYEPVPIRVDRLMLSSLGAWLNVRGSWPIPVEDDPQDPAHSLVVEEWRHLAAMGRDNYVRVVIAGCLMPLGNRASRVVITERKFQKVTQGPQTGKIAAFLRQRTYIIVREPVKTFPAPGQEHGGREWPYKSVRITTLVTPNLDKPELDDLAGKGVEAFWPKVGGQPFQFHLVGTDADGQRQEFTAPLAFVRADLCDNEVQLVPVRNDYNASVVSRRRPAMRGQKVAYAPSTPAGSGKPAKPGDTAHETVSITLGVRPPGGAVPTGQPRFYPRIVEAEIRLQAAEQAAGQSIPGATVEYPAAYLSDAFAGANKGAVYLKMKAAKSLGFATDKSGGVATPNLSIGGLSRMTGPVGGVVDTFTGGNFTPSDFFQGAAAKILGGIDLFAVIQGITNFTAGDEQKIPKLTTRTLYPNGDQSKPPDALETKLSWKPDVKDAPFGVLHFKNPPGQSLSLEATLLTKLQAGGEQTYDIVGTLTNFDLNLFGTGAGHFITVEFKQLSFTAKTGKKANVDVDIEDVTFHGALKLIDELQSYLETVTGGTGPSIDIKPIGITAGVSIGLPTIAVGVFSMQNIAIGIGLNIPFDGTPVRLRFNFCERENPFILTVSIFGGGGFVGLAIGGDGVEMVEMSLEFGGNVALDIGVASGGIYLMAGVYLKVEGSDVTLTGYVRMGGELEILGIITLSCEFYMGLTYESVGDKVYGQASLTVEVEVLFFSASVTMSVERQFAGSSHAFSFTDLVPTQAVWKTYAEAFA